MELYIIHRKATWEVSVKTPFRHLKVENNIPPAKTLSRAAFPARTWSCPWPFCEWMCFSTPGKYSPWPLRAALSDSSRCGNTGKACPEGGKDRSSQSSWECLGFLQHNLSLEFPATLAPEPDPLPTSVSRVWTPIPVQNLVPTFLTSGVQALSRDSILPGLKTCPGRI